MLDLQPRPPDRMEENCCSAFLGIEISRATGDDSQECDTNIGHSQGGMRDLQTP
jgi:hypothetical protein